jgi:MFS family permease
LIARVAQGFATAIVVPAALALLLGSFPEGKARDKALGLNGSLMAAGFTTGAILGGLLTDLLSWRWALLINVPVAIGVLIVAPMVLRESRAAQRTKLDIPGAITVTLGLLALVFGLTRAAETSWTDPLNLGSFAAAVVLFIAFALIERRAAFPLVPLRILTRSNVSWGNVTGLLAFVTETSLVFLLTLYLQKVLGYSPLAAGYRSPCSVLARSSAVSSDRASSAASATRRRSSAGSSSKARRRCRWCSSAHQVRRSGWSLSRLSSGELRTWLSSSGSWSPPPWDFPTTSGDSRQASPP